MCSREGVEEHNFTDRGEKKKDQGVKDYRSPDAGQSLCRELKKEKAGRSKGTQGLTGKGENEEGGGMPESWNK